MKMCLVKKAAMFSKTYIAMNSVIEASLYFRDEKILKIGGIHNYIHEYGTINFHIARRSGHTTIAGELLPKYFNSILWLVQCQNQFRTIPPNIQHKNTIGSFLSGRNRGQKFDCLVIDCASYINLDNNKIFEVIDKFAPISTMDKNTTLFLLQ